MRRCSLALMVLTILPGCSVFGTKTILVQPGTVVKTTRAIKGEKLLVPDKDGNLVQAVGDIPPGASVVVPLPNIKRDEPKAETVPLPPQ